MMMRDDHITQEVNWQRRLSLRAEQLHAKCGETIQKISPFKTLAHVLQICAEETRSTRKKIADRRGETSLCAEKVFSKNNCRTSTTWKKDVPLGLVCLADFNDWPVRQLMYTSNRRNCAYFTPGDRHRTMDKNIFPLVGTFDVR